MFPKNEIQSLFCLVIIILVSFCTIGLFETLFKTYIHNKDIYLILKDLFSYLFTFLVIHGISQKQFKDYKISAVNTRTIGVILLTGIFISIIGLFIHYLLFDYFISEDMPIYQSYSIGYIISLIVLAPIFEELIIRGIILENLLKKNSSLKAIILTTIIFVVIHFDLTNAISLIICSTFYCWVYIRTKNILICMFLHSLYNVAVILSSMISI